MFSTKLALILALVGALKAQQHQVAITIDDLPRGGDLAAPAAAAAAATRSMTEKLLTPFQAGRIPLTGFVNECHHTRELRDLLRFWIAAGAELGNHTCSHLDLSSTPVAEFEADFMKGEAVTGEVMGRPPRFFRYPFLHTGQTDAVKQQVEEFVHAKGYIIAPVTIDDEDYVFARVYAEDLALGKTAEAERVINAYVKYMDSIFAFFGPWGIKVAGHDVKQILLIHASQLNADAMPRLLQMMRRQGYEFIPLGEALTDDAYQLPDTYVGPMGISSLHRWAMAKGLKVQWEPESPEWIMTAYKQLTKAQ